MCCVISGSGIAAEAEETAVNIRQQAVAYEHGRNGVKQDYRQAFTLYCQAALKGDAESADIYAQSYGKNPEFYAFYRSLQAYQTAFEKTQDTLVLKPDSDFFRYFNSEK